MVVFGQRDRDTAAVGGDVAPAIVASTCRGAVGTWHRPSRSLSRRRSLSRVANKATRGKKEVVKAKRTRGSSRNPLTGKGWRTVGETGLELEDEGRVIQPL